MFALVVLAVEPDTRATTERRDTCRKFDNTLMKTPLERNNQEALNSNSLTNKGADNGDKGLIAEGRELEYKSVPKEDVLSIPDLNLRKHNL